MIQTQNRNHRAEIFQYYLRDRPAEISMQDLENLHALTLRAGHSEAEVFSFLMEHLENEELLAECIRHAGRQNAQGVGGLEFALADWYARSGESDQLDALLEQFRERPGVSRRSLSLMLASLNRHDLFEEAVGVADRLVREFPDDIAGHVRLIRFLKESGQEDAAQEHLELLRAWAIANRSVPREFAIEFENQTLIDEAEIMLDDAMRMASPTNALQVAKEQVQFFIRTRQVDKLRVAFQRFMRQFGSRDDLDLLRDYLKLLDGDAGDATIQGLTPDVRKALGVDGD